MKKAVKKRPLCIVCILLMLLILLAKLAGLPLFGQPPEDSFLTECIREEKTIQVIGRVTDRVEKTRSFQYILSNSTLQSENQSIPLNTISMISTSEQIFSAGSFVVVSGILSVPEQASNPGQFDLNSYYAGKQIYYSLYCVSCRCLQDGGGAGEALLQLKSRLTVCLEEMTDPDTAEILKAMLLGDRTGLTEDMKRRYQVAGILHILAISGMHISLLGQGLLKILEKARLPFPAAAILSLGALIGYCFLTGAAASAVRAVCMFAVLLGARLLHRTYDSLCALALAGIGILLENPAALFTSGFQLSFCAILAVSLGWPSVAWLLPAQIKKPGKLFQRPGMGKLERRELLLRAGKEWVIYFYRLLLRYAFFWLSITIILLPITAWYYYEVSLWGLLPNLLLLPAAPILITSGVLGILGTCISPTLGRVLFFPAEWILKGICFLAEGIRKLPWATFVCGKPKGGQVFAASVLLLIICACLIHGKGRWERVRGKEKRRNKRKYGKLLSAGVLLFLFLLLFRWEPDWSITMLDVGQGDCLVLRNRDSCFLMDGGSSNVKEVGKYRILPYLRSQGISNLDGIFVSHPDEDHVNGILEVFSAISDRDVTLEVNALYLPGWMKGQEEETELVEAAKETETNIVYLTRGDRITAGNMEVQVLNPFSKGGIQSGNSGSLVLSVNFGAFDALLTGDLETDGEEKLLPLGHAYEYLKVAHHGSKGSSSKAFLSQVQPVIAVVSAPEKSIYGHPHKAALERIDEAGSEIFVTRDCGAIRVEGNGNSWKLTGFLQTEKCIDFIE